MSKIIDLTYDIKEGMLSFPSHWHIPVEVSILGRHSLEHRETRKVVFSTHTGTHIDAPAHFIKNGKTLSDIPLEKLVGQAVLIDLSFAKVGDEIGVDILKEKLKKYSDIKKIVFFFDWGQYWDHEKFYDNWPHFSKDAIKYLAKLNIDFIGMDTPSPDFYENGWKSKSDSPNHKILLAKEIVICEYMANLDKIEKDIFELYVLPIKLEGSDGAPARCIAVY
jgi:arylformamidase